ncbi:MAG: hypothetical protein HQL38_07900 [Alphaproteobacteria bacterium]|nr:hypothetical protein [Alphaproteobacteria bacterium]
MNSTHQEIAAISHENFARLALVPDAFRNDPPVSLDEVEMRLAQIERRVAAYFAKRRG